MNIDGVSIASYIITLIFGGGLFKAIVELRKSIMDSREKKELTEIVGAKTPAEIESISVSTMAKALESSRSRIIALEEERDKDREYYQLRIREFEEYRERDKNYYEGRITELMDQLTNVREELATVEEKLARLVSDLHTATDGGGGKNVSNSG